MMTKEEIIKALESGITSWGMYEINWDAMDAMEKSDDPFAYVKPILDIIGTHPDIDFGTPGMLVHYVEQFSGKGYEELLIDSVRKNPTPHNIWMVHRCYNDCDAALHGMIDNLLSELREDCNIPAEIKKEIEGFAW